MLKGALLSTRSSPQHRSTHSISGGIADMSGATAVSCEAIGPHTVPTGPKPSPISAGSAAGAAKRGSIASPIAGMLTKSQASKHVAGDLMEFTQEQAGDVVIVKLAGRLDSGAARSAEDGFNTVLAGGPPPPGGGMSGLPSHHPPRLRGPLGV